MSRRPPRVLQFVPGFRSGGVESLLLEIYRSLDRELLQFDFLVDTIDPLPVFAELRRMGARVFQLGRFLDAPLKYHLASREVFQEHRSEYVALHCHDVLRALPLLWLARSHGIPKRILHQHSSSLAGSPKALVARAISRLTLPLANELWACSTSAANFYFSGREYSIIPNVIRADRFRLDEQARASVRKSLGIPESAGVVGHTGRFTYLKNHEQLLRVFAAVKSSRPDAQLLLVGDGPLQPRMRMLASELSIESAVHFVGTQSDVAPFLCAMDVFVLPSFNEGFCISLLEAQANGLHCLVSTGVPPEAKLVTMSVLDVADPVAAWAAQVLSLLSRGRVTSDDGVSRIRSAGLDVEGMIPKLLKLYAVGPQIEEVVACV